MGEPESSLARAEGVLCGEPFKHCTPLPHYPTGSHGSNTRALEVEWSTRSIELVERRYHYDLLAEDAVSSSRSRSPRPVAGLAAVQRSEPAEQFRIARGRL